MTPLTIEQRLEKLCSSGGDTQALRRLVFLHGIRDVSPRKDRTKYCSLRAKVWKALLGVDAISMRRYADLVAKGAHPEYGSKILNDSFRTFQQDNDFARLVPEKKLIRLLNAFVHAHEGRFPYVQGMNALCGPFLYIMPELDAFYCFEALVTKLIPTYVSKNLTGTVSGCRLAHKCLQAFDPDLAKFVEAELGFSNAEKRSIYSLAPWDVCFAVGAHINLAYLATYLILHRDKILGSSKGRIPSILTGREHLSLEPTALLVLAVPLLFKLPKNLLAEMSMHSRFSGTQET